jgi:Kef-type K+ transport system membrane component KefB
MDFSFLIALLFAAAVFAALIALAQAFAVRRHWRARRRFACAHRGAWLLVFVLLTILLAGLGLALRGYGLLTAEAPVANVQARQLGPQWFGVRVDFPDGTHRSADLRGDEWQLDARVIKWAPRAVALGAQPLFRVDRLSGRYRDATRAGATLPTIFALDADSVVDLWQLKQNFPRWLPWIDADYGSAAFLPLVDGGTYKVTISPLGGLVARPADAATAQKLKTAGW